MIQIPFTVPRLLSTLYIFLKKLKSLLMSPKQAGKIKKTLTSKRPL